MGSTRPESVRHLAWALMGLVVFMLFAVALRACVLPQAVHVAQMPDCHGTAGSNCLIECQKVADQAKPSIDFHLDFIPAFSLWATRLLAPPPLSTAVFEPSSGQPCRGPPLQILFCSFQK